VLVIATTPGFVIWKQTIPPIKTYVQKKQDQAAVS